MKTLATTLILIIAFSPLLFSQNTLETTNEDADFIINYLKETEYAMFKAIKGIPLEEWNYRPQDSGWTIGEIAEHVVEAEKTIYSKLKNTLLTEENKNGANSNFEETDQEILKLTTDRSIKLNAPEAIRPTGKWATPEDFLIHFEEIRNRTIDFVENSNVNFRLYMAHFPPLNKKIDGYDWLLIIPSHTQRHLAQIAENKEEFLNKGH